MKGKEKKGLAIGREGSVKEGNMEGREGGRRDVKEEGAWEGLEREGIWTSKNSWGLSPPSFKILAPALETPSQLCRSIPKVCCPRSSAAFEFRNRFWLWMTLVISF